MEPGLSIAVAAFVCVEREIDEAIALFRAALECVDRELEDLERACDALAARSLCSYTRVHEMVIEARDIVALINPFAARAPKAVTQAFGVTDARCEEAALDLWHARREALIEKMLDLERVGGACTSIHSPVFLLFCQRDGVV